MLSSILLSCGRELFSFFFFCHIHGEAKRWCSLLHLEVPSTPLSNSASFPAITYHCSRLSCENLELSRVGSTFQPECRFPNADAHPILLSGSHEKRRSALGSGVGAALKKRGERSSLSQAPQVQSSAPRCGRGDVPPTFLQP